MNHFFSRRRVHLLDSIVVLYAVQKMLRANGHTQVTGIHQQRRVTDNALYLQITVSLAHVHVDYQTQKTLYTRN